nr:nucleoside recognition domain-containing protein [Gorillibacterium timonense]
MLFDPGESLQAAVRGTAIWWDVLFPALFPFFLASEVMLGFGIVHFFGTLLDPLMRPLFRIPGIGGFVMAMGFASGYPVSAKLTSRLMEQKLINREEGERLVAFTTSSDPIFLIGAVSVGFFGDARVALLLAAAHYGSALVLGFLMRFHGHSRSSTPGASSSIEKASKRTSGRTSLLARSFDAMHEARLLDGRPLGLLLREAIASSLKLVFVVGGLVVFFSVFLAALRSSGLLSLISRPIAASLELFGLPAALSDAIVGGLFEVTLGTSSAGQAEGVPLLFRIAAAAFVLSWAGLSVHAQVLSLLTRTTMRYWPFCLARLLHGIMAAVLVFPLAGLLSPESGSPSLSPLLPAFLSRAAPGDAALWLTRYGPLPVTMIIFAGILLLLVFLIFLQWISYQLYNRQK